MIEKGRGRHSGGEKQIVVKNNRKEDRRAQKMVKGHIGGKKDKEVERGTYKENGGEE